MTNPLATTHRLSTAALAALLVLHLAAIGCAPQPDSRDPATDSTGDTDKTADSGTLDITPPDTTASDKTAPDTDTPDTDTPYVFEAQAYEASAEQLLAARLPIEQTAQGWIRLFDGHTMFGWIIAGEANWRIEDGSLIADRGRPCLLTTTTRWDDFELELEYSAESQTNSGVFLRTEIEPKDPAIDCFEINIAPADNPYPTGSIVQRKKALISDNEASDTTKSEQWQTMNVVCNGNSLVVKIDGEITCESDDASSPAAGFIGLQFRSGRVRFRNIRLRPIGLENLLDAELTRWKQYEEMPGDFKVNDEQHLVVNGGKQQLESTETYGDFLMLADYQMPDPASNSGLFFRAIPGDVMMGYECQVSNEIVDGNPLQPADCGAGGIFRRQDARIVAGEPQRWNSIVLNADGPHFATWVNGLQVTDVLDDRSPDINPRKGTRLQPGTLIVQGHDETTQATYRTIAVKSTSDLSEPENQPE